MKVFKSLDILILLALLHGGSLVIYYLGFVYSATVMLEFSTQENPFHAEMRFKNDKQKEDYKNSWFPVQSSRVFVTLFDGVLFNWVVDQDKLNLAREQKQLVQGEDMPLSYPISSLRKDRNKTLLFHGYSEPPTMTAAKVKAILQGTFPDMIEILSNVRGNKITTDNIIYQEKFHSHEKKAVIYYGYDIWGDYVGHIFDRMNLNEHSGNISRMMEIEQNNYSNVEKSQLYEDDWSSLFTNYQILDVAAHTYKSIGSELYPYLQSYSNYMSKQIENAQKIKDQNKTDTTFLYFSDHGENPANRGMHGGGSELETSIFVFGYDTHGFLPKEKRDIGQIMDKDNLNQLKVSAMDIAATFCMLRGIPIPMNSIGMIIPDFFIDNDEFDNTVVVNNFFINVKQIERRIKEVESLANHQKIIEIEQTYSKLFDDHQLKGFIKDSDVKHFVELCLEYGRIIKQTNPSSLILPNRFWALFSVMCWIVTFVATLLAGEALRGEVESRKATFRFIKRGTVCLCLVLFLISLAVSSNTWLFYSAISFCFVGGFTLTKLFAIIKKQLIEKQSKFWFINQKQLPDTLLLVTGILFNGVIRLDYKWYARTQDLTQLIFILFYLTWSIIAFFQNDKSSILKIILIGFLIFFSTYFSEYQNLTYDALFVIEPLKQFFEDKFWRFTFPLIFLIIVYKSLFQKASLVIKKTYSYASAIKKVIFQAFVGGFLILQIYCVASYFDFLRDKKYFYEEPIRNYFVMNYFFFFVGEIFKLIFLRSMPFTWKFTTFIISFLLTPLISIGFQSVFQYAALIVILQCLGQLSVRLRRVTKRSKYIFLSLLSSWFFYASDHFEKIEAIHVDLFNIGQICDGVLFPIVNGTNNHFFGQITIAIIIPLFVIVDLQSSGSEIISFSDSVFGNVDPQNGMGIDYQLIQFQFNQNKGLGKEKQIGLSALTNAFVGSITDFLLPCFFTLLISILRNSLDPQNQNMNSDYLPSFLYQILFSWGFLGLSIFNHLLISKHLNSSSLNIKQADEIQLISYPVISQQQNEMLQNNSDTKS